MKFNFKLFKSKEEHLIYLLLSIVIFILRLRFNLKSLIICLIAWLLITTTCNVILKKKKYSGRFPSTCINLIITWAILTFIFNFGFSWYFSGFFIYAITKIIYMLYISRKYNESFINYTLKNPKDFFTDN